ncbi:hypothetical protein HDV00_004342 [Rhizophlyctis rosea]|nr:hypothetical protein HDV00_004342 [Rhizophlyctis rosea]
MRIKLGTAATNASSPLKHVTTSHQSSDSVSSGESQPTSLQTTPQPSLAQLRKASRSFPSLLGSSSFSSKDGGGGARKGVEGSADDVQTEEKEDSISDLREERRKSNFTLGRLGFGRGAGGSADRGAHSPERGSGGGSGAIGGASSGRPGLGDVNTSLFLKPPTFATSASLQSDLELSGGSENSSISPSHFGGETFAMDSALMQAAGRELRGGARDWDSSSSSTGHTTTPSISGWSSDYFPLDESLLPPTNQKSLLREPVARAQSPLARFQSTMSSEDHIASTSSNTSLNSSDYEQSLENLTTQERTKLMEEPLQFPPPPAHPPPPAPAAHSETQLSSQPTTPTLTRNISFARSRTRESFQSTGSSTAATITTPKHRGDRKRLGPILIGPHQVAKWKQELGEELYTNLLDVRAESDATFWDPFAKVCCAEDGTAGYSLMKPLPPVDHETIPDPASGGTGTIKKVASGSLPTLVQLLAPEGGSVVDSDYINDFLLTWRYFAEGVDVARLLCVRYVNVTMTMGGGGGGSGPGSGAVSRSSTVKREKSVDKKKSSLFKSSGVEKEKDKEKDREKEKQVPETVGIVQLRILNVFKKWVEGHPEDFEEDDDLAKVFYGFMEGYIMKDERRAPFAKSILGNLEVKLTQRSVVIEKEGELLRVLELERQMIVERAALGRGSIGGDITSGRDSGRLSTVSTIRRSVLSTQSSISDLSGSTGAAGSDPTQSTLPTPSPRPIQNRRHSAILPSSFSTDNLSGSSDTLSRPSTLPSQPAPLVPSFSFTSMARHTRTASAPASSSSTSSFANPSSSSPIGSAAAKQITSLTDIDPITLSHQLTLLEHAQFLRIRPTELLHQSWNTPTRSTTSPNLTTLIGWFNRVAYGVATEVVSAPSVKERVTQIKRFIYVAQECFKAGNFNSVFEVVAGLNLGAVARLKRTWRALPKKYWEVWEQLNVVVSSEGSYRTYRQSLKTYRANNPKSPVMPYLGVTLSDLTFTEDGNPTYIEPATLQNHPPPKSSTDLTSTTPTSTTPQPSRPASPSPQRTLQSQQPSQPSPLPIINFTKFRLVSALISSLSDAQSLGSHSSTGPLSPHSGPGGWNFTPDERVQEWLRKEWVAYEDAELYDVSRMMEPKEAAG